jgi:hypothetical protein
MRTDSHCPNDGATLKALGSGVLQCPECIFNVPPNTQVLREVFAWVSVDTGGNEGFIAAHLPGMPLGSVAMLMNGVRATAENLRPIAEAAVRSVPGYQVKLVRYARAEVVE